MAFLTHHPPLPTLPRDHGHAASRGDSEQRQTLLCAAAAAVQESSRECERRAGEAQLTIQPVPAESATDVTNPETENRSPGPSGSQCPLPGCPTAERISMSR
jgi:hypothetical protein